MSSSKLIQVFFSVIIIIQYVSVRNVNAHDDEFDSMEEDHELHTRAYGYGSGYNRENRQSSSYNNNRYSRYSTSSDSSSSFGTSRYGSRRYGSSAGSSSFGSSPSNSFGSSSNSFGTFSNGGGSSPINSMKAADEDDQNIADKCFRSQSFDCDSNSRYRTFDGSCNNLKKPWWGMANTAHVRLMKPYYQDDRSEHRRSIVDNSELPSARLLSTTFLPERNVSDIHTRMYLQFSQLVAHDVTLNVQSTEGPKCCSDSGNQIQSRTAVCKPISIPNRDPFYSNFDRKCLEYKQSQALNCSSVQSLQPIVSNSHFIDASFIYGSSNDKSRELRTGNRGQLRVRSGTTKGYLPTSNDPTSDCPISNKNCYNAGDVRINQHLDLAVSQNVFLRFHNFIADKLIDVNPRWRNNDEMIYQEARRIVGAVFQNIVYRDWLPILIGPSYAKQYGLTTEKFGYFEGYDDNINPSTLADFSGAAFRTLHSLIPSYITLVSKRGSVAQRLPFSTTLQKPGDFMEEGDNFDSTIRGMLSQQQQYQDRFMTEQMTNFFIDADVPTNGRNNLRFGDDLSARDIQRGRDFGLRPYVDYRELCGLTRGRDFYDFSDQIDVQQIAKLADIYKSALDVDYYIGGLLEKIIMGTLTTSSNRCVLAEAFYRYKYGDRYYFESSSNPSCFSSSQLRAIKSITLSMILCIGGNDITEVQVDAFYQSSSSNPSISCSSLLDELDLSSFRN